MNVVRSQKVPASLSYIHGLVYNESTFEVRISTNLTEPKQLNLVNVPNSLGRPFFIYDNNLLVTACERESIKKGECQHRVTAFFYL